jgi:hypothetical protein
MMEKGILEGSTLSVLDLKSCFFFIIIINALTSICVFVIFLLCIILVFLFYLEAKNNVYG